MSVECRRQEIQWQSCTSSDRPVKSAAAFSLSLAERLNIAMVPYPPLRISLPPKSISLLPIAQLGQISLEMAIEPHALQQPDDKLKI
ncbi:MAG: hypothetical protein ACR2P3_08525 [Geminicoccaceae bacterium]